MANEIAKLISKYANIKKIMCLLLFESTLDKISIIYGEIF